MQQHFHHANMVIEQAVVCMVLFTISSLLISMCFNSWPLYMHAHTPFPISRRGSSETYIMRERANGVCVCVCAYITHRLGWESKNACFLLSKSKTASHKRACIKYKAEIINFISRDFQIEIFDLSPLCYYILITQNWPIQSLHNFTETLGYFRKKNLVFRIHQKGS
jgi:hypothetical protein